MLLSSLATNQSFPFYLSETYVIQSFCEEVDAVMARWKKVKQRRQREGCRQREREHSLDDGLRAPSAGMILVWILVRGISTHEDPLLVLLGCLRVEGGKAAFAGHHHLSQGCLRFYLGC